MRPSPSSLLPFIPHGHSFEVADVDVDALLIDVASLDVMSLLVIKLDNA